MTSTLPVSNKSIRVINNDLLEFPENIKAIVHGCNTRNNFGAGIALAIKNKFPAAFAADTAAYKLAKLEKRELLGDFSFGEVGNGRLVYNLYQQPHWRKPGDNIPLDYDAFETGLKKIRDHWLMLRFPGEVIGLPWCIGCGLAGGNWKIVSNIICETFEESEVVIVKLPV